MKQEEKRYNIETKKTGKNDKINMILRQKSIKKVKKDNFEIKEDGQKDPKGNKRTKKDEFETKKKQ